MTLFQARWLFLDHSVLILCPGAPLGVSLRCVKYKYKFKYHLFLIYFVLLRYCIAFYKSISIYLICTNADRKVYLKHINSSRFILYLC